MPRSPSIVSRMTAAARAFASPPKLSTRAAYEAATFSRRWPASASTMPNPARSATMSRAVMASRAAFLASNSPYAARACSMLVADVIGVGITARSVHPTEAIRTRLDRDFAAWSRRADFDGGDLAALQAGLFRDVIVSGEGLGVWVDGPRGPQLRRLPSTQIDSAKTGTVAGGGTLDQGIEYSPSGLATAFWLRQGSAADPMYAVQSSTRIPADRVLHIFRRDHAGQRRGTTWLAAALLALLDLDRWQDAALVRQQIAALFAGFISDSLDGENEELFPGQTPTDTDGIADAALEPGVLSALPAGKKITFTDPPDSSDFGSLGPFILRSIASAIGVPATALMSDFSSTSYSSARVERITYRRHVEQAQYSLLVPAMLDPIWGQFLKWEMLTGRVPAAAVAADREAFTARWVAPTFEMVDPLKDAQAAVTRLDNLLASRSDILAEWGEDAPEIDRQIAADNAREQALGLARRNATGPTETPLQEDRNDVNSNA